jgi:hypothetical protein
VGRRSQAAAVGSLHFVALWVLEAVEGTCICRFCCCGLVLGFSFVCWSRVCWLCTANGMHSWAQRAAWPLQVCWVSLLRLHLWICCWYELDLHLLLRAWTHTAGPGLALSSVVLLGVAVVGAGKELHAAGYPSATWDGPCLVVALLMCSRPTLLLVACACLRQCSVFGGNWHPAR